MLLIKFYPLFIKDNLKRKSKRYYSFISYLRTTEDVFNSRKLGLLDNVNSLEKYILLF